MAEVCSCGAQLPEDALFCHKCGKPQRNIVVPEVEQNTYLDAPVSAPPVTPASILPPPMKLPLNFHNPIAVRISLLSALAGTILSFLVPFLSWLAGGFFAVFFYSRKTGSRLNIGEGVKIGWITGLITYVIAALVFTAVLLPDALSGKLGSSILETMKTFPSQDPTMVQRMQQLVQTGSGVAMVFLSLLVFLFVIVTCLSMAGGALGAKVAERN